MTARTRTCTVVQYRPARSDSAPKTQRKKQPDPDPVFDRGVGHFTGKVLADLHREGGEEVGAGQRSVEATARQDVVAADHQLAREAVKQPL